MNNIKKIIYPALYAFISYWLLSFLYPRFVYLVTGPSIKSPYVTWSMLLIPPILGGFAGVYIFKYFNKIRPSAHGAYVYALFLLLKGTVFNSAGSLIGYLVFLKQDLWAILLSALISYLVALKISFGKEEVEAEGVSAPSRAERIFSDSGIIFLIIFIFLLLLTGIFCGMASTLSYVCSVTGTISSISFPLGVGAILGLLADMRRPWISSRIKIILALGLVAFATFIFLFMGF